MTPTNYFYNGDGARVKKTYNGVTTYYVGALYEYTTWTGGSSISKFYYFGSQRIAVKQDINISYIHSDHLGSTSKTTGASSSTQTYYPFGAIKTSSGTVPTDYGFTGQKRDATASLMFYSARYYDPSLARFVQPDTIVPNPMDPQSLNRYSYVRNNPVNRIDPTGHEDCAPEDAWCWENRWYEAHGSCWSDATQDWSKSCQPEFQDEDILKEVLGETNGIGIVIRANALKVMGLLLASASHDSGLAQLLPNFLVIGGQISGGIGPLGFTGYVQLVIDFKHYQVGFVYGGGLGVSFGVTPASVSLGPEMGLGYCSNICHNISNYGGYGLSLGGSAYGLPIGEAPIGGGGIDINFSGDLHSFYGQGVVLPNGRIVYDSGTLGIGSPNAEVHAIETYSFFAQINNYQTLQAFQTDLYNSTLQYTGRSDWAATISLYAGIIPHENPLPE